MTARGSIVPGWPPGLLRGAGVSPAATGRQGAAPICPAKRRWATRDGGDSGQVAAAISAILDRYIPRH